MVKNKSSFWKSLEYIVMEDARCEQSLGGENRKFEEMYTHLCANIQMHT